jgi:AraC-like DNA-binding protein
MSNNIILNIQFITLAQLTLLTLFALGKFQKPSNRSVYFFLSGFLLTKSLSMLDFMLGTSLYPWVIETQPVLLIVFGPFAFLYAPLFFFYVKSVCKQRGPLNIWQGVHFLPAIVFVAYAVIFIGTHLEVGVSTGNVVQNFVSDNVTEFMFFGRNYAVVVYLLLSLRVFYRYRLSIESKFSGSQVDHLNWLKTLIYGFLLVSLWSAIMVPIGMSFNLGLIFWQFTNYIYSIFLVIFSLALVYKSMSCVSMFSSEGYAKNRNAQIGREVILYQKCHVEQLLACMSTQKPYLNPNLGLEELSSLAGLNSRQVSQIISDKFGENFYRFVNRYRVAEAKMLLSTSPDITISRVIYDSGFNSKSSFHEFFKLFVGTTPSNFRKNARELVLVDQS